MKSLGGVKIPLLDFLFILCLVIYGGNSSVFTRGYGNLMTLGAYVPLVFAIIIRIKHHVKTNSNFINCLVIFIIYWLVASIVNRYFSLWFISYWIVTFYICYVACKSYGLKYIDYFETVVFYMTIISMVFWFAYLASPTAVTGFCESFRWGESFSDHTEVINIGVYTILDVDYSTDDWHMFYRNAGFGFEPGAFASFICFAIACNLYRNKGLRIKNNFPLFLYLGALFSTESTTGAITLIIIVFFWLFSGYRSFKTYIYIIILIPAFIWIIGQDFVGAKFLAEYDLAQGVTVANAYSSEGGTTRLMSFVLYFQEFLHNPILGLAGNPNTYLSEHGFHESLHSGFGRLLAGYGIIMTMFFVSFCIKSQKYSNTLSDKNYLVILAALIGMMVSYSMWEYPVFFTFVIMGFYMGFEHSPQKNKMLTQQV